MGVSENVVYPIVPNGFADHYPYEKWLAIIGNITPTFSDKPTLPNILQSATTKNHPVGSALSGSKAKVTAIDHN